VIDLHSHVVPTGIPFVERLAIADNRWLRFADGTSGRMGDVLRQGAVFRRVSSVSWDLHERREGLESQGVTAQALSAMPELLAQWADPDDAVAFDRSFNNWLATAIAKHRGFYRGLGLVPAQSPERATELLAEIDACGLDGVLLPSHPIAGPLHTSAWEGFLGEVARRGLLLLIHAIAPPKRGDGLHPRAANGVVFPNAIGEAAAGLIAAGTMARHPSLKLLLSHGGGSLVSLLPRITYLRSETPELQEVMPDEPITYARRMWFDPLVYDAGLLRQLADAVGMGRIVHGTDYPFMRTPLAYLDEAELTDDARQAIDHFNPARLLAELDCRHDQSSSASSSFSGTTRPTTALE
jgi:aminocarboxymuconate-semialdehyde decarboxylase